MVKTESLKLADASLTFISEGSFIVLFVSP